MMVIAIGDEIIYQNMYNNNSSSVHFIKYEIPNDHPH